VVVADAFGSLTRAPESGLLGAAVHHATSDDVASGCFQFDYITSEELTAHFGHSDGEQGCSSFA
jgi:hypothetical protein